MKVTAILMVRDEEDIIATTIKWLRGQVDDIIVADNMSTDRTPQILRDLGIQAIIDTEPGYYQSIKMTGLAHKAALAGAQWIVPCDADELWWSPHGTVADVLRSCEAKVARASLYNYVATGVDDDDPDPVKRLKWRSPTTLPLPKTACRWTRKLKITQGNHEALYDNVPPETVADGLLRVRHYPMRSVEQVIRKVRNGAAAYKAASGIEAHFGAHWRSWGEMMDREGPVAIENIFRKWYWRERPDRPIRIDGEWHPALVYDPCPSPS